MKLIVYLVAASFILIGSCSPQGRINRIVRKNTELLLSDSLRISSRIIVPERTATFKLPSERIITMKTGDTISEKSGKINLVISRSAGTTSFEFRVPADTIEKDTMVPITKINVTGSGRNKKWKRIDWIIFSILFASSSILLASLIRKRRGSS
jgi:hypothetical protein